MSEKLSERLEALAVEAGYEGLPDDQNTLREAAAALRAVEGAAVVEWSRDSGIACAHLRGQLVRIVPEQNP